VALFSTSIYVHTMCHVITTSDYIFDSIQLMPSQSPSIYNVYQDAAPHSKPKGATKLPSKVLQKFITSLKVGNQIDRRNGRCWYYALRSFYGISCCDFGDDPARAHRQQTLRRCGRCKAQCQGRHKILEKAIDVLEEHRKFGMYQFALSPWY
jgi:hypothetical protein